MNSDFNPNKPPRLTKWKSILLVEGVENIQNVYNEFIGAKENEKAYNVGGDLISATVKEL